MLGAVAARFLSFPVSNCTAQLSSAQLVTYVETIEHACRLNKLSFIRNQWCH